MSLKGKVRLAVEEAKSDPKAKVEDYSLEARWRQFTRDELGRDPPRKVFVWECRIPLGDVGVIAGQGAGGKTSLNVGLAVHRALDLPFLGKPVRPGSTVMVTTEDNADDYLRKLAAWREWMGASFDVDAVARHVHILDLAGIPFRLIKSEFGDYVPTDAVDRLVDAVKAKAPDADLIIIETVSRLGGDEGNSGMSALVCAAEQVAIRTRAAVLLVSHVSKAMAREKNGDAYAPRGGGAITDNCRAVLTLTKIDQEQVGELLPGVVVPPERLKELLVLRVPKINSAPPQEPVVLQRIPTRWGIVVRLFDAPCAASPEQGRLAIRASIGEALRDMAVRFDGHLTENKLGEGLYKDIPGLSKGRIAAAVQAAVEDGHVHRGAAGRGGGRGTILPGRKPNPPDGGGGGRVQEGSRESSRSGNTDPHPNSPPALRSEGWEGCTPSTAVRPDPHHFRDIEREGSLGGFGSDEKGSGGKP